MIERQVCSCMCHGRDLAPGFPYPWCLECFKVHGEPRPLIEQLRRMAGSSSRVGGLRAKAMRDAADELEKLLCVLMAVGLALRQTQLKDDLRCKMISLLLQEVDL